MREHREGCRVVHDGYGTCHCKPMTTPLTSEQCPLCTANRPRLCDGHYQASADNLLNRVTAALHDRHTPDGVKATYEQLLDLNAALRQTITQQAQELESAHDLNRIAALAMVEKEQEVEQLATLTHTQAQEAAKAAKAYAQHLAAMTTERDEAEKIVRNLCAQAGVHHPNCIVQQLAAMTTERDKAVESTYVPGSWSCPVCQFAQVNSVLCATSGRVGADTESVPLCPNDGTLMKRETWKGYVVAHEKTLVEKLQQLAASQQRVMVLEKGFADQTAIRERHEAGFKETIAQLQATLAEREARIAELEQAAQRNAILGAAVSDKAGWETAKRFEALYDTDRQDAARLRVALEYYAQTAISARAIAALRGE